MPEVPGRPPRKPGPRRPKTASWRRNWRHGRGRCLDGLPPAQREVVLLRDVEGLDAAEVCSVLGISDANQRVLLHRGRARARCALGEEMGR